MLPSATSIPICSRSATIARWRIISTSRFPCRGQCRGLEFPDRSFDAYTIAFGIRNVPRIDAALREAYRVLRPGSRFLCLEFSTVDVPGLDQLYDFFSFKVIPPLGRAVTGDAELTSTSSNRSGNSPAQCICRDDPRRRLFAGEVGKPLRRHRGVAFGLAFVISAATHIARLVRAATCSRAKACSASSIQVRAAARTARAAAGAADRTARRQIRPAAVAAR